MYTVANHVGRLVEVTLASPLTLDEVQSFVRDNVAVMKTIAGNFVGVADLRGAHVFPAEVADRLIQLLSANSSQVERSAMLIGDSATFAIQVERVIRTANHPNRKIFRNPGEMVAWLNEVLTVAEQEQLQQFLRSATDNGRR
ncbi:MAG TPA: hypothetical protein VN181_05230 [Thermoanaerobaculia bacterium]|nr:hypothetical protein [Thermoanaerobaculia bacterium]